jgi:Protein of unknown function (DUF1420)
VGDRRADLVSISVSSADCVLCREILSPVMTVGHTLGLCAALIVSTVLLSGAGAVILRFLKAWNANPFDTFLLSTALGAILLELAVSLGELAPNLRGGVRTATAITALVGLAGFRSVFVSLRELSQKMPRLPASEKILATALFVVLALQGFASLAPLTGSDALHYHFTMQALYLADGFSPRWSLLHGFFCGLSHQLILAGLALGSSQLALGWLFLGGALGCLATLRLARLWAGGVWPWLAALAFALTPVSLWQTTAAGAPDIWMCAFVPLCLLAILKSRADSSPGFVILAGILAGAVVGTKYTGLIFAAALLAGFLLAARSARKCSVFLVCAVVVGIWPYLRNWIWTGDPVFPFLYARMQHANPLTNRVALTSIFADTGAAHTFSLWELLKFFLLAAVDQSHLGAWQLLGPLVLIFGPFAIWRFRASLEGRVVLVVWILGSLGIGVTSAMSRFLLPLLPVALAASVAGIAQATQNRWRLLRTVSLLTLAGFIVAGFFAMIVYSRTAWSVVAGRTTAEKYLVANSPDYQRSEFVNREVERQDRPGRVLIFFRHLYYVHVPFFNGDPEDSWPMNSAILTNSDAWERFFSENQIRWVLKSPDYPAALADSLAGLEKNGMLRSCASGEVESFSGYRIEGNRVRGPITLYCVQNASSTH